MMIDPTNYGDVLARDRSYNRIDSNDAGNTGVGNVTSTNDPV